MEPDQGALQSPPEAAADAPYQPDQSPAVDSDNVDQAFEEQIRRIRSDVEANRVLPATLHTAIQIADLLIENQSNERAVELLGEIETAVEQIDDEPQRTRILERYQSTRKRSDHLGKTFDYDGLYDINGEPIPVGDSSRELKLIVFWSIQSPVSRSLIDQIQGLRDEFISRRVKVIAVCQVADSQSQRDFRQLADDHPFIEFCQLKQHDRSSERFAERFPVRKYPYLVMLSVDDQVVGINVDPVFFDPIGH